ncbi:unnamed protein product, partial [Prorocentrum cordatum]
YRRTPRATPRAEEHPPLARKPREAAARLRCGPPRPAVGRAGMPSAEAPPELRLLAALEGAVRASDARAAGGLLADPSLQAPMRRVAERLHQLVDPRLHSFVLPAPALRRTAPAPRPPPASEGPPSAPSREPRGGEGAWPAPRHADAKGARSGRPRRIADDPFG